MAFRSADDILKRYNKAKGTLEQWRDIYQDVYKVCMPNRNLWETTNKGQDRMDGVYTSVGITAANSFVNRLISSVTPPFKRWAGLTAGPAIPKDERDDAQTKLDSLTEILFSYIHTSNFDQAVAESYHDLVAGTCAMLIMAGDKRKPLNFTAVPTAQLALERGAFGEVGGVYRNYQLEQELIEQQWPDAQNIPKIKRDEETTKLGLIECTYYCPEDNNWKYCVMLEGEKTIIVKREYKTNPWVVLRWDKMPEEVYGRGPGVFALADLKMLNKVSEYSIRAFALKVFPPYTVADDSVLDPDKFLLQPAALNIVERNAGPNGPSIMPLPAGGDVPLEQFKTEQLTLSIKKQMLDDQLPSDAGPVRSATEIAERIQQQQIDTGGSFGRIMSEWIRPIIIRCVSVLNDQQLIPAAIDIEDFDEFFVKIDILSPLARQQHAEDLQGGVRAVELLGAAGTAGTVLKMEELSEDFARQLGVPAKFVRDEKERTSFKAEAVAAQERAAANEAAIGTAGKVVENESKK